MPPENGMSRPRWGGGVQGWQVRQVPSVQYHAQQAPVRTHPHPLTAAWRRVHAQHMAVCVRMFGQHSARRPWGRVFLRMEERRPDEIRPRIGRTRTLRRTACQYKKACEAGGSGEPAK